MLFVPFVRVRSRVTEKVRRDIAGVQGMRLSALLESRGKERISVRSNTTVPRHVQEARQTARRAATNKWVALLARLGYAVKGVVYVIIGWLAAMLAVGHGGTTTDQRGALTTISGQPFGKFLLVIVTIGLFGYALWSII